MRANSKLAGVAILSLTMTAVVALVASCDPARPMDEHQLAILETVWNQAHERGDADTLDKLWAEDLQVAVPKMPVMSKAQALGFARSGRMKFERYATSGLVIHVYGDAGVVTGKMERVRTLNEKQITDHWQFTKVYVRKSGKWRVVAFHASEAPE
jgi:hypothetical protein